MEKLPRFKYHPNPLDTGAIENSGATCECCGKARGYAYSGTVYSVEDVDTVCPWCIADGSLHRQFDATLNDDHPLSSANLAEEVIVEITCATPGYVSWQQDRWMTCCNDACEFHGDAPQGEIRGLDEAALAVLSEETLFPVDVLRDLQPTYESGGSPAFYKFVCRHCGVVKYNGDCD